MIYIKHILEVSEIGDLSDKRRGTVALFLENLTVHCIKVQK
jgi:hypothetical protein